MPNPTVKPIVLYIAYEEDPSYAEPTDLCGAYLRVALSRIKTKYQGDDHKYPPRLWAVRVRLARWLLYWDWKLEPGFVQGADAVEAYKELDRMSKPDLECR